jgi:hypothetical protein
MERAHLEYVVPEKFKPQQKLGTLGFPFWWKNYQITARVARKLKLGFMFSRGNCQIGNEQVRVAGTLRLVSCRQLLNPGLYNELYGISPRRE